MTHSNNDKKVQSTLEISKATQVAWQKAHDLAKELDVANARIKTLEDRLDRECARDRYNGWTNYATWRVMLECFDGDIEQYEEYTAETCEDIMRDYIADQSSGLASDYANSFLSDVNWNEIATKMEMDIKEERELSK